MLDALIGDFSLVVHHSESGESIDSVLEASRQTGIRQFTKRWERMYVLQLARFASRVLWQLDWDSRKARVDEIPAFSEIFALFQNDDAYFRSCKTWLKP